MTVMKGFFQRRTERRWLAGLIAMQDERDEFGQRSYDKTLYELRIMPHCHWHASVFPIDLTVDQARAYARHRILGARLHESFRAVISRVRAGQTVRQVFGEDDGVKVLASLALFCQVDGEYTRLRRQLAVATLVADRVRQQRRLESSDSIQYYKKG